MILYSMLTGLTLIWEQAEVSQSIRRLTEGCRFSTTHLLLCLLCPRSIITFFYLRGHQSPPSLTYVWAMGGLGIQWFWGNPKSKLALFISSSNTNIYNRPLRIGPNTFFIKGLNLFKLGRHLNSNLRYLLLEKVTPILTQWFMANKY